MSHFNLSFQCNLTLILPWGKCHHVIYRIVLTEVDVSSPLLSSCLRPQPPLFPLETIVYAFFGSLRFKFSPNFLPVLQHRKGPSQ